MTLSVSELTHGRIGEPEGEGTKVPENFKNVQNQNGKSIHVYTFKIKTQHDPYLSLVSPLNEHRFTLNETESLET